MCGDKGRIPVHDGVKTPYLIKITLPESSPYFDIKIWTRWELEAARMRLKLNTQLGAVENYYEVPFGVVERKPYGIRTTARGEWPVHRFAAMENTFSELGIALLNKGTVGVEAEQGILNQNRFFEPLSVNMRERCAMIHPQTTAKHGLISVLSVIREAGEILKSRITDRRYNQPPLLLEGCGKKIGPMVNYQQDRIILSGIREN